MAFPGVSRAQNAREPHSWEAEAGKSGEPVVRLGILGTFGRSNRHDQNLARIARVVKDQTEISSNFRGPSFLLEGHSPALSSRARPHKYDEPRKLLDSF